MTNYYVYVIELDPIVLDDERWSTQSPDQNTEECFYVGQSAHEPECRFEQHIAPRRSHFLCQCPLKYGQEVNEFQIGGAKFVNEHAIRLRPDLYEDLSPLGSKSDAEYVEAAMAKSLREQGHGAWYG